MSKQYHRILLKLSGEALMGSNRFGYDIGIVKQIADDIKEVYEAGYQISIVVGGGNIFRGSTAETLGIERASGDYMGMLATVMNAIAMQSMLEKNGILTRIQSAISMITVAEPYTRRRAIRHMEKKRIVIFAAGTGNPFFTTDTAAVLRAAETNCDLIMKGTQVDGVYCSDPKKNTDAKKHDVISYKDVIVNDLNIMDTSAITLARDNKIPIIIFNVNKKGSILQALEGNGQYSIVR
jgi:uridylate kinase